jgi:hypothetical protein
LKGRVVRLFGAIVAEGLFRVGTKYAVSYGKRSDNFSWEMVVVTTGQAVYRAQTRKGRDLIKFFSVRRPSLGAG